MNNETNRLAQLIANAADKELGTRPDGQPRRQDKAAAQAIEAEYLFIRRAELPAVGETFDKDTYYVAGDDITCLAAAEARGMALSDLALWQHLEAKEEADREEQEANRIILERRNNVALHLTAGLLSFDEVPAVAQRAIIKIIELEDKAA